MADPPVADAPADPSPPEENEHPPPRRVLNMVVLSCGAVLFSDGYATNVIGSVATVLEVQYGDTYRNSLSAKLVKENIFIGAFIGQLLFGFISDLWPRSNAFILSTFLLAVFTLLSATSYAHGGPVPMFSMLTAWRFLVGIALGGGYPAGSVGCAESSSEMDRGSRNRWFIMFTNSSIDLGFVMGAFVPYVISAITHNNHYSIIWRTSLGFGAVVPIFLLFWLKLRDPANFDKGSIGSGTPYRLVLKLYWFRLLCISLIWFIYDFNVYSFGNYTADAIDGIRKYGAPLSSVFGWHTVVNLFYLPGTLLGAFVSDWRGPKNALILGACIQSCIGFILAVTYPYITKHTAFFAVVYGLFVTFGELGPGDNIGLLASKTCAAGVRGRYYGIAGAAGKIGATVGTLHIPFLHGVGGENVVLSARNLLFVTSFLGFFSAAIASNIPNIGQDNMHQEDVKFREYLERNG